jgi:hypothetical protein
MKDPVELLVDLSIEDAINVINAALVICAESFATQQNKVILEKFMYMAQDWGQSQGFATRRIGTIL